MMTRNAPLTILKYIFLTALIAARAQAQSPAALEKLVCAGKNVCHAVQSQNAGADGQGFRLTVIKTALFSQPVSQNDKFEGKCDSFEYWLIKEKTGQPPQRQMLMGVCNDGYGAAMLGSDEIIFGSNLMTWKQTGGSNWRWSIKREISLSPLRILRETTDGYWSVSVNREHSVWDWRTFSGRTDWYSPVCNSEGNPPEVDILPAKSYSFIEIPHVNTGDSYRSGWRNASPGVCAASVDSSGVKGFIVHGRPGSTLDATMKVVMDLDHTLYIEISDDTWIREAASWIYTDHLEIWSVEDTGYSTVCLNPRGRKYQWGISLFKNEIYKGDGQPAETLTAERQLPSGPNANIFRIKIKLPESVQQNSLAVVYSDSDDGRTQERLISTSQIRDGDAALAGSVRSISENQAVCELVGSSLTPKIREKGPDGLIFE